MERLSKVQTQEAERILLRRVNNPFANFLEGLNEMNLIILSDEQVRKRIALIRDNSTSGADRLRAHSEVIRSTMRLLPYIIAGDARRIAHREPADLITEAYLVLDRSIDAFNPDYISERTGLPVRFSAYVRASLAFCLTHPRTVEHIFVPFHMPYGALGYNRVVTKVRDFLYQELAQEQDLEVIYDVARFLLPTSPSRFLPPSFAIVAPVDAVYNKFKYVPIHNEVPIHDIESDFSDKLEPYTRYVPLEEIVPDDSETGDVASLVENRVLIQQIMGTLSLLTEKERLVIELRFGIDGGGERRLEEVAQELSVLMERKKPYTRERIRQIEYKALSKMRSVLYEGSSHKALKTSPKKVYYGAGAVLKLHLIKRDLSTRVFGELIGMSYIGVSSILSSSAKPSQAMLNKISGVLGLSSRERDELFRAIK